MKRLLSWGLGIVVVALLAFWLYWKMTEKTIAILLYDDFSMLEVVGAYQAFPGLMLQNYHMKFVAKEKGIIKSSHIQSLQADYALKDILTADIVYIPGGENMEVILRDTAIISWIKKLDQSSRFTLSTGGGTLLLAKAGILDDKEAATHWYYAEQLEALGAQYKDSNYIKDGKYYTGMGASAAIDMVLELIDDISGQEYAEATQLFIEYDPAPPIKAPKITQADSNVQQMVNQLLAYEEGKDSLPSKTIAMLLYDGFTMLDMTGPYQVFRSLESLGYTMKFVAKEKGRVDSDLLLSYQADYALDDVSEADILFIPGGSDTPEAMQDKEILDWCKKIDSTSKYTISVCTGSLLLAKAGLLKNKRAACHWYAGQFLKDYGAHFSQERYTIDEKYLTGAGVSSGIDLALLMTKTLEGRTCAEAVQLNLGYFPNPSVDAGSPSKSSEENVAWLEKMFVGAKKQYAKAKTYPYF